MKSARGHARAIATAPDPEALVRIIVEKGLSVRETERLARDAQSGKAADSKAGKAPKPGDKDADTRRWSRTSRPVSACLSISVMAARAARSGCSTRRSNSSTMSAAGCPETAPPEPLKEG